MNTSPVHVCYHSLSVTIALDKPGFPELTVSRDGIPYFRLQTGMVFDRPTTNLRTTPSLIEHTFTLSLETPHYTKRSHCTLEIHEATLDFGELVLHLHLSDQGFAYRWQTRFDYATTILDETFDLTLLGHPSCLYAHHNLPHCDDPFQNSWESVHHFTPLKAITPRKLIYLPITFCYPSAAMSFTEAELIDYPGLNLQKTPHHPQFTSLLARAAKHVDASNRRNAFVLERHAYLVQTNGRRYFPWRICMMADAVAKLYENDLPYLLSHPAEEDFKWVRPGRVAWEWWNAWGLEKVAFTPGVNTATYKVYIDFAHTFNLPYVILDEGWAQQLDITKIIPEIDLPELIRYAAQRHVQLILWASWPQLIDCQEIIFNHYASMGIAGFKIDFYDRDDVAIAQQLYDTAAIAAKYHLVLAYHGIHKPTGLSRTYPNVLTYEGVFGLENTKWTTNEVNFVQNDVRLAFARLLAGPMDYTPGAMTNRHRADFQKNYTHPMSMGTRCHQAAMFVVYDTGLQMLCDAPTAYLKEPAYTHFITALPLLWDETVALPYSHPEKCLAVLRSKANTWVFAVLNNDQARTITIPTWLLPKGHYLATALVDGPDIEHNAESYHFEEHILTPTNSTDIIVAAGGGCVVCINQHTIPPQP